MTGPRDHHGVGVIRNLAFLREVQILNFNVIILQALADEAVALQRCGILNGVFSVSFGEIDSGSLAFDQADDRRSQLLFALESSGGAGRRIELIQVVLLHEAG